MKPSAAGTGSATAVATADPMAEVPEFSPMNAKETALQIGKMNVLAISGGRIAYSESRRVLTLKCGNSYYVEVGLAPTDTYTVRRVFARGGKRWVKGEEAGVYADQLGESAYRAGMFRDAWPAGGINE